MSRAKAEKPVTVPLEKADYVRLSHFRYRLRRFLRISETLCQQHGLTALQYQALLHLKGNPERDWATIGEVAECLQAKHHGVVALIDRCEKMGLVKRIAGTGDRRVVEVHLLPKGMALLEELAGLHQSEVRLLQEEFALPGW